MLGLTVDCFDFQTFTLEIYQQAYFDGHEFSLICPKTPSGQRIQSMPEGYARIVKEHIHRFHLKPNEFIFFHYETSKTPANYTRPAYPTTFRRALKAFCRNYDPNFHPHMLRTSICTHLREKGIPLEEISRYLGHGDADVTGYYYLKTSQKKEELLRQTLEAMLEDLLRP